MTRLTDMRFESWPSHTPIWHGGATRADEREWHVDLGCGTMKKARIGVDRFAAPGVNVVMNLDTLEVHSVAMRPGEDAPEPTLTPLPMSFGGERLPILSRGLPFLDNEVESIISHHCFEHVGDGFIALVDDIYRVLKPGGVMLAITPLFPSTAAVEDPDHRRYFMESTWNAFCGHLGSEDNPTGSWLDSFSVPYTKARFELLDKQATPPTPLELQWTPADVRELRVLLRAVK